MDIQRNELKEGKEEVNCKKNNEKRE